MAIRKKSVSTEELNIDLFKNVLVPEARILSGQEKADLLAKYNIAYSQLPRILIKDPVCKKLNAQPGDIIEFKRKTEQTGLSNYYRLVIGGN